MSLLPSANQCCSPCESPVSVAVPGPAGSNGSNGAAGAAGTNAYTTTSAQFTMPAEGANVTVSVVTSAPFGVGQILYIESGGSKGYFEVISKPTSASMSLQNIESTGSSTYATNSPPGTIFASGGTVSPAGLQGPAGSAAAGGLLAANNLSDVANVSTSRTNLGLGTAAVQNVGAFCQVANNLSDVASAATSRTNLGLAIGTNVQAYDATLQSISSLGTAADRYAYTTGVDTWAEGTITSTGRSILDDATTLAVRTTLGLTIAPGAFVTMSQIEATGASPGGITSGSWVTRGLDSKGNDTASICSLNTGTGEFTLAAGTYQIIALAAGYAVDGHAIRLYDVTNATTAAWGVPAYAPTGQQTYAFIVGRFTNAADGTNYRIEQKVETTNGTNGLGRADATGAVTNYFAAVLLWREASV